MGHELKCPVNGMAKVREISTSRLAHVRTVRLPSMQSIGVLLFEIFPLLYTLVYYLAIDLSLLIIFFIF